MSTPVRVRFAPSPTGALHVGGARTALFNWGFARRHGGAFVLRVEDTDRERSERRHEEAILEDLAWLGLAWDEGPDCGGPHGPYRQSERLDLHREAADRLLEAGTGYPCFCSTAALEAEREAQVGQGLAPVYSGACRRLPAAEARRRASAEPHVLRFRLEEAVARDGAVVEDLVRGPIDFGTRRFGDPVLWRSEAGPTYNFVVVVDDAAMRITHVIRGEDHLPNTPLQVLLARALGHAPPAFAHLPLVHGPQGAPLSKRTGSTAIGNFRRAGYLPEALVNYLALLGWSPPDGVEVFEPSGFLAAFGLERVGRSAAAFDFGKLAHLNAAHLRRLPGERLGGLAAEHLADAGFIGRPPSAAEAALALDLARLFAEQLQTLGELPARARVLFVPSEEAPVEGPEVVRALADAILDRGESLGAESVRAALDRLGAELGLKGKPLLHPARLALTGHGAGPPLDRLVEAIEAAARLPLRTPVIGIRDRLARALARSAPPAAPAS